LAFLPLDQTSAGGKDLSNDPQIIVIGPMEPEICTKMLKKLSEKLRAKFPAPTRGYSMAKIACLNDAFSECFKLEASHCSKKKRKGQKGKVEKKKEKIKKPKHVGHYLKILISAHA